MKNDWIVANLNNPDFTVSDFQNIADMSTSNTQMLSKDQYLKSDFIKSNEAFKDEQGRFSQKKFDNFYNSAAKSFQDFLRKIIFVNPFFNQKNPFCIRNEFFQ